uniref:Uncharacterized protein n=1 Tax=Arundo donax TaxID=35708 RepID=A0A0A8XRL5_ARUDO
MRNHHASNPQQYVERERGREQSKPAISPSKTSTRRNRSKSDVDVCMCWGWIGGIPGHQSHRRETGSYQGLPAGALGAVRWMVPRTQLDSASTNSIVSRPPP